MVIIENSGVYKVYDEDSITSYKSLPVGVYTVNFSQQAGYFLTPKRNVYTKEKMYGPLVKKIDKALNGFEKTERNFGVALGGQKGLGKTMWTTKMIEKCIERGYPVVVVDSYIPNIAAFIESIDQKIAVIFDEFDKIFYDNEDESTHMQDTLLSMFDGIASMNKFFILTYNDKSKISEYLISRPGRIKYTFEVSPPDAHVIEEYLTDKLTTNDVEINILARKLSFLRLSFDSLRAITEELNDGYSIEETLDDLNITPLNCSSYCRDLFEIVVKLSNGTTHKARMSTNFTHPISESVCIRDYELNSIGMVNITDAIPKFTENGIIIPINEDGVEIEFFDIFKNSNNQTAKERWENVKVKSIKIVELEDNITSITSLFQSSN